MSDQSTYEFTASLNDAALLENIHQGHSRLRHQVITPSIDEPSHDLSNEGVFQHPLLCDPSTPVSPEYVVQSPTPEEQVPLPLTPAPAILSPHTALHMLDAFGVIPSSINTVSP